MSVLYRALEATRRIGAPQPAASAMAEIAVSQAAAAAATTQAVTRKVRSHATKRRLRLAAMVCLPIAALMAFYSADALTTPAGQRSLTAELVVGVRDTMSELVFGPAPAVIVAASAPASAPAAVAAAPAPAATPQPAAEPAPNLQPGPTTSPFSSAAEPPPLMSPIAVAPMAPGATSAPDVLNPTVSPAQPPAIAGVEALEPLSPFEVAAALKAGPAKPPKSPLSPSEVQKTLERAVSGDTKTLASLGMLGSNEPVRIERTAPPAKALPQINVSVSTGPSDRRDRLDRYRSAHSAVISGDLTLAVNLYQELLRENGSDTSALFGLASAQQRLGRDADARTAYEKLLKLDPENTGALSNLLALVGRSQPDQALLQLEDMRKNHPTLAAIPAQLAGLYAGRGMLDQAIANAKQAAELAPDNMFYVYNVAILNDHAGRRGEAAAAYRDVLQRIGAGEAGGLSLPVADIQQRLAFLSQR